MSERVSEKERAGRKEKRAVGKVEEGAWCAAGGSGERSSSGGGGGRGGYGGGGRS